MSNDVELLIRQNTPWQKLPTNIKQSLGNSQKEYEKSIVHFSVKNQLRYRGNLIRQVRKDERRYYEEVLAYSRSNLLLYPYHLSDIMVEGLRVTPFQYYTSVLESIMDQERSYDSLPNFTAADCLRLLGIGRNEYIDLMNQCRSGRKLFRRKNVRDFLPSKPVDINIEPWWTVAAGCIVEDDIKLVSGQEKELIDRIIDHGKQRAGGLDMQLVHSLYKKGLIYLEVPIEDSNYIVVPPLEGFVMNRVLGDYFETLLYKIFVSIDEHTTVGELANVLQIDAQSVKNAVSLYCRLGFARRKCTDGEECHPSWKPSYNKHQSMTLVGPEPCLLELSDALADIAVEEEKPLTSIDLEEQDSIKIKRICFLFDSTLTAFLMMGNLSPGLKNHAVTMFEVGKLLDESMDGFINELEKVSSVRDDNEGEARPYFEHALILRATILALRYSTSLHAGLDLVRCESLYPLEPDTLSRLLAKNYSLLVSMAPLSKEICPITSKSPPHLGPATPEVNSIWFKMFLYHIAKDGPPSILITRGTRLRKLPFVLRTCDKVLVTSWGHEPIVVPLTNLLFTLNDALTYSPVLAQAYGIDKGAETRLIPFPFKVTITDSPNTKVLDWSQHRGLSALCKEIDFEHTCGYVTMVLLKPTTPTPSLQLALPAVNKSPGVKDVIDLERPKNGFHTKESVDILKQELDNLSTPKSSPNKSEDIKQKSSGSNHPDSDLSSWAVIDCDLSDWTVLDCCFGVPLFDEEVNRSICATIADTLCEQESLAMLAQSNEKLSASLKQFILEFHDLHKSPSVPGRVTTHWPKSNLVFSRGILKEWDGE